MANKYCNIEGTDYLDEIYDSKINNGFNLVENDTAKNGEKHTNHINSQTAHTSRSITYEGEISADNIKDALDTTNTRVSGIIAQSGTSDTEVVDARNSSAHGVFATLRGRCDNGDALLLDHLNFNMPHLLQDLKTGKTYRYGNQINIEGKPQKIYEEVI